MLTETQQRVFDFMLAHLLEHQRIPTNQEIADEFKYASVNSAYEHIRALKKKRVIESDQKGRLKLKNIRLTVEKEEADNDSIPEWLRDESTIPLISTEEFNKKYILKGI